ncbi:diguanylate cyclase domain-containing protein [Burkholderia sp. LMG 13014]|uniref:diguanylate cyclase domain-containing protein n=1 Tax=Burkholderia sp. LMG 13014 TaxID=2709306 RepID=UPI0023DCFA48|nr:diguanylate cyclase [Burkholderia sp. LMG 13014]
MFFEHCVDGIAITDERGYVIESNASLASITGLRADALPGWNMFRFCALDQGRAHYRTIRTALATAGIWRGEASLTQAGHHTRCYPVRINTVRDEQGCTVMLIWTLADETYLAERQRELIHLAHHDPLTGLPNRRALMALLACLLDRPRRTIPGAVLYLDLDKFKQVNDALGHKVGDDLLRAIAVRLSARIRRADMVARLGGDEFVIVLERIADEKDAGVVAAHVIEAFRAPFELAEGKVVKIGVSVGVAILPAERIDAELLLDRADRAMYTAKGGRGACLLDVLGCRSDANLSDAPAGVTALHGDRGAEGGGRQALALASEPRFEPGR